MRCFISYKFTGEDPKELEVNLKHICNLLDKKGHSPYCSFWDTGIFCKGKYSNRQILEHALKELDKADFIVVFIKSAEKSEGMLIEIGYAMAKNKKIILIIKKGVETTFVGQVAHKVIEFESLHQLSEIKDI